MSPRTSVDRILSRHSEVFEGIGKLSGYQLLVHTDPIVAPVAQPLRPTPFHVRKDIEKKLKVLQDLDIIEDVDGSTPWVSPLVAVPKSNGDIRVCVDMRRVNETILRERHPIPTLEETLQDLNGATVFSKLDLRWGYHQVDLHFHFTTLLLHFSNQFFDTHGIEAVQAVDLRFIVCIGDLSALNPRSLTRHSQFTQYLRRYHSFW